MGILILVVLALAAAVLPVFLRSIPYHPGVELLTLAAPDTATDKRVFQSGEVSLANPDEARPPERFYFDPNHLPESGWQRLGVPAKTAKTIGNFRRRGGRFRVAADLLRIYGLKPGLARELEPWVRFQGDTFPAKVKRESSYPGKRDVKEAALVGIVDINDADSLEWLSLPGIGPYFTSRILRFRRKLGGFFSVDQVAETYGIPDSVFRKVRSWLRCRTGPFRRIDLNRAPPDTLAAHPYINRRLAYRIVNFRNAHGAFRQPGELYQLLDVDSGLIRRIIPYLLCDSL